MMASYESKKEAYNAILSILFEITKNVPANSIEMINAKGRLDFLIDGKLFAFYQIVEFDANADENAKLICESVVPFEDVPRKLWIRFASEEEYLKKAADLAEELKYSDGKDSIIIYCTKENKRIALPQSRNIRITPDILASLRAQYGIKNVETT